MIDTQIIISIASVITALGVIFGAIFSIYKWYLRKEKNDTDIKLIKEEQKILTKGILACLKGLQEKGCNGPVTEAIENIEDHINKQAHKYFIKHHFGYCHCYHFTFNQLSWFKIYYLFK